MLKYCSKQESTECNDVNEPIYHGLSWYYIHSVGDDVDDIPVDLYFGLTLIVIFYKIYVLQ